MGRRAKILRWLGINKETADRTSKDQYSWEYKITEVGYKYQLCDILAAIGLVQLKRLDKLNARRREITRRYNGAFKDVSWITTPIQKDYADSSNHNYVIKIEKDRERFMRYLGEKGITTGIHYLPVYRHDVYSNIKADCPVVEKVWKKLVTLPLFPDLTDDEADYIIDAVKGFK